MKTTMKKMSAVVVGLLLCAVAAQAAVINTYDGAVTSWWNLNANGSGAAAQWFTVPAGTVGTKFEFYCEKGATVEPAYSCIVAIYTPGDSLVGIGSLSADQFSTYGNWVPVTMNGTAPLSLVSGSYYAQMWTNQAGFSGYLHAGMVDPGNYSGGYAAGGWNGGTPTGDNQDFYARLTVEAIPEPATGLILLGGLGLVLRRRR